MTPPNLSLFFIMICFWLTMWLVYQFLIVPVGKVVGERRRRIDDAQSRWDTTHGEFLAATGRLELQLEEAAREAAAIRGRHRHHAFGERQRILDEARAAAERRLDAELAALDADAAAARRELRDRSRELARLFASRLLERGVGR
jgi:F-type H+-transporting ATPase subunit b